MRSSHDENLFADQELIVQNLRQRAEWNPLIEQVLQFDIAARKHVAHDHQIGTRIEVPFSERLRDRNTQRCEKCRHRRICRRIRARNAKATLLQHASERRHRRSANADQVNVLGFGH